MSDNGGGEDGQTVLFKRKTMAKVPSWGEPILLIIAVVCFIPFLGYMIIVGVPYVIYKWATKKDRKVVAPPLDKIEEAGAREYDLVIVGATGYTGGWAVRYMSANYGQDDDLNWAIAGRNPKKLKALLEKMKTEFPDMKTIPTIVADSMKMEDMENLAKSTRCVASFAGPFLRYGAHLVRACAKYGTHYSDSTGEMGWIRQMIAMYYNRAVESKARIIPICGFDAIPADLTVYACHKKLREMGDKLKSVKLEFMSKGAASGGTLETIATMSAMPNIIHPSVGYDPLLYFGEKKPAKVSGGSAFCSKQASGRWAGFSLFGPNNKNAVKRSAAFHGYNDKFYYEEVMGLGSAVLAAGTSLMMFMSLGLYALPPSQWVLRKFLPAPGQGPDRKLCERGYYSYNVEATGEKGTKVYMSMGADNEDPGYKGTSRMVVETALLLLEIPDDAPVGILTPGCLGDHLMKRLEKSGSYFNVGTQFTFAA